MPDAIDWVYKNAGQGQFANVDKSRLAAAGQSCGGVQAFSASLDKRVSVTGIFNSGLLNEANTKLFNDLHGPVGLTNLDSTSSNFHAWCASFTHLSPNSVTPF